MPATSSLDIAFFGSSLVSSYWNGAATYYRGIIKALAERGHRITFYEPDALQRQQHRDMDDPDWARVVVYPADEAGASKAMDAAQQADVIIKASGVGVLDEWLEQAVLQHRNRHSRSTALRIFWDVDAPATLERLDTHPNDSFHTLIPQYDLILTYGGGEPVVQNFRQRGARHCEPIYNAVDPQTHHPVAADPRFQATLGFLGNRLPDREARVHAFFFQAVAALPESTFLLGGSGWDDIVGRFSNLNYLGHVYTRDHNAFNCSPLAVLNINRDSMARVGFSPPTRVFEAAGAGACLILDQWDGIELFLQPDHEVLVAASGDEVIAHLQRLTPSTAYAIGQAARRRVLAHHTYAHRALQFEEILQLRAARRRTA